MHFRNLIDLWDSLDKIDPQKFFYNLSWFGGIEALSVFLYISTPNVHENEESWWHYILVVFIVPCLVWLTLYMFRILCKWFFTEYVCVWFPKLKKYLPAPGEK
jgi:hypothetical protein